MECLAEGGLLRVSEEPCACPVIAQSKLLACSCHCCRFIFVVEGEVQVKQGSKSIKLPTNHWAYFGPAVDSK